MTTTTLKKQQHSLTAEKSDKLPRCCHHGSITPLSGDPSSLFIADLNSHEHSEQIFTCHNC